MIKSGFSRSRWLSLSEICNFCFFLFFFGMAFSIGAQTPQDSLLKRLESRLERDHIPGLMISIVRSDSIIYAGGIGYADIDRKTAVDKHHLFRLGSISKTITAMGLLKMSEEGLIDLSAPIADIDERLDFPNPWAHESHVTVENILEHTAGYDDMHIHAFYNKSDSTAPAVYNMVLTHLKSLYSRWRPGTRWAYSNPGFVVAGHLIETITKTPYARYLQDKILVPLGMEKSGFYFKKPTHYPVAQGYKYEGYKLSPVEFVSIQGGPAGDFCSNAEEMSRFLQFMIRRQNPLDSSKAIIAPHTFERMESAQTTLASKNGYKGGYGPGNMTIWRNGYTFHGHDGGIDGFSSLYLYSREADLGIALSINRSGDVWPLMDMIMDHFVVKKEEPNELKTTAISSSIRDEYSGFYCFKNPRNQLFAFFQSMNNAASIEIGHDFMTIKRMKSEIRDTLYHGGNNLFYQPDKPLPSAALLLNAEGKPSLWSKRDYAEPCSRTLHIARNYFIYTALFLTCIHVFTGFIWILIHYFGKYQGSVKPLVLLWFSAIAAILIPISFIYCVEFTDSPGEINGSNILLYVLTLLTPILTIGCLYAAFKVTAFNHLLRYYYYAVTFSLIGISLILICNDYFGFRLWSY